MPSTHDDLCKKESTYKEVLSLFLISKYCEIDKIISDTYATNKPTFILSLTWVS